MVVSPDIEGCHSGELVPLLLVVLVSLDVFPDEREWESVSNSQNFIDNIIFGLSVAPAKTILVDKPVLIWEMRPWLSVAMRNHGSKSAGKLGIGMS
jgi:hypothetical protein